jgi:uncharacterized protein YbbK (DUF523 family)
MAEPRRVLVSACLLGERVRYHGGDAFLDHPILRRWLAEGLVVPLCPEVEGGLPTPRPAAEIQGATVRTRAGIDVTPHFLAGAEAALSAIRRHGITVAVLKDGSPSCGSTVVHDGSFSGARRPGEGVTTRALRGAGVRVFSERELEAADAALRSPAD